ncbi:MAG TPA: hypothetical protein PLJ73_08800, partial [Myxococcota bacterium]|nr:hypothetical protein [Myxococcota bacterium]
MKKAIFTSTIVFMFCFPAFADDVEAPEAGTGAGAAVEAETAVEEAGTGVAVEAEAAVDAETAVETGKEAGTWVVVEAGTGTE